MLLRLTIRAGWQWPATAAGIGAMPTARTVTPSSTHCLSARRFVEQGVRFVTVNMFDSLAGRVTWDCHANESGAPATLADYRNSLCPEFDRRLCSSWTTSNSGDCSRKRLSLPLENLEGLAR